VETAPAQLGGDVDEPVRSSLPGRDGIGLIEPADMQQLALQAFERGSGI
jgi:hypothetical protein